MTMHKYKAQGERVIYARPTHATMMRLVLVWCGREVPVKQATRSLSEVSCVACREAYATYLSELEDVVRPLEETEP